jgi:mono/diheme cytochrome c family protein
MQQAERPMPLRTLASAALLLLASCAAGTAPRGPSESAERGLAYAEHACARCHGVTSGEISPIPEAPTFVDVANAPRMGRLALDEWLQAAHPTMPDLIVAPEDRADLAAYLETLNGGAR